MRPPGERTYSLAADEVKTLKDVLFYKSTLGTPTGNAEPIRSNRYDRVQARIAAQTITLEDYPSNGPPETYDVTLGISDRFLAKRALDYVLRNGQRVFQNKELDLITSGVEEAFGPITDDTLGMLDITKQAEQDTYNLLDHAHALDQRL